MTDKISPEDFQRIYKVVEEKGGIVLAIVFVALLFGILFLSLWVGQISKNTGVNTTDLESRLIQLEEEFQLADEVSTEFLTDTGAQLQFLDKEIKKLWDLSNKRNKVNIQKIFTELEAIKKQNRVVTQSLNQLKASSVNANKELKELNDIIRRLNVESEEFKAIAQQINALQRRMLVMDETIQAFDNFRRQTNQSIVDIQTLINETKNSPQELTSP
jgi:methyl-accepting chemotaxis protein|tara:strand:- start:381 stop:1028 length:648 start_codon:yes stop_codon:yes gene_type:complete